MKSKIIIALAFVMACLTGCATNEDFIGSIVDKNNPGLKVGTENYIAWVDDTEYVKSDAAIALYEVLSDTSFKDCVEYENWYFTLDTSTYLEKICESENIELIELDEREEFNLKHLNAEECWEGYHWVYKDDCMYLVNSNSQAIKGSCYFFISKNEEIKNAMIDKGLEHLLEQFEYIDNNVLEFKNSYLMSFRPFEFEIMNCGVELSGNELTMKSSYYAYYDEKIAYLDKLNQLDAWVNISSTSFDDFDTLTMMCFGMDPQDAYMRMDLYGSKEELQEIKITYYKTQGKILDNCKYTIIRCLEEMGCDKATAEKFLNEEFSGKGKVGDLNYVVQSLDKESNCVKIYH